MLSHIELMRFLAQLAVMLATGICLGQLARKVGLPAVLGELVGGIFLGPTLFGTLFPDLHHLLFHGQTTAIAREAFLKLGLILFLFVTGTELNLLHMRQRRRPILLTSLCGILLPFVVGVSAVVWFPTLWGVTSTHFWFMAFFVGTALSISALPVIAKTLMDLNLLRSPLGGIVLASATIDDILGWILFATLLGYMVPMQHHSFLVTFLGVVGLFGFFLTLGRRIGKAALQWLENKLDRDVGFIGVSVVLALVFAVIAEYIGLHAFFGAFLVGIALSPGGDTRPRALEMVYQFVMSFFAPLYFVSVGLKANFLLHFDWKMVLVVVIIACFSKIIGAGFGAWMGKLPPREAIAVGIAMNARGVMEILLASIALDYHLIDERLFVALVVMALVTSMISGPIIQRLIQPSTKSVTS